MASSDSQSSWHPWHYSQAALSADRVLPHSPGVYHPALFPHHDADARGDPRLLSIVQRKANLEFGTLKLLESKYQGKALRRWADGFAGTFGHIDDVGAALGIVMQSEGVDGDAALPFIGTLVKALRDAQSAQLASVSRREPSQGGAPEAAQPAAEAAARRADSLQIASPARARLQSWLQAPEVAEVDDVKRRRILSERALLEFPLQTPEARDAWAETFCRTFFPSGQLFYKEDVNAILREVVAGFGVSDAAAIEREVSRLAHALSKHGACNTKNRGRKRVRPARRPGS